MNAQFILLWCLFLVASLGCGSSGVAANALPPGVAGRYTEEGGSMPAVIEIRADGTCSMSNGPQTFAGTYAYHGNYLTITLPGRPPGVFPLANGILTAPDGTTLRRTGEAAAPVAGAGAATPAQPAGGTAPAAAPADRVATVKSIMNVRQLCMACQMWAGNHQGAFPDTLDQLRTPEYLGKSGDAVLHCPLLHDDSKVGYVYLGKGHKDSDGDQEVVILSRWQDAQGHRIVGHANSSVGLELPKVENFPAAARAIATALAKAATGGTPAPAPAAAVVVAGPSQVWHVWNAATVPKAHPVGESFTLTFTNRLSKPVRTNWLSPKLEHTFYTEIPPGGTAKQGVKKGAIWLITDSADAPLGYFVISEGLSQAVIPER